jgi:hypothetical protein
MYMVGEEDEGMEGRGGVAVEDPSREGHGQQDPMPVLEEPLES